MGGKYPFINIIKKRKEITRLQKRTQVIQQQVGFKNRFQKNYEDEQIEAYAKNQQRTIEQLQRKHENEMKLIQENLELQENLVAKTIKNDDRLRVLNIQKQQILNQKKYKRQLLD
jgi:hypothetical protein